jgi:putative membrane protein insertion efficiency factor
VSFFRRLVTAPIRFYRRYLSRLKPPMCRFSPTCSGYAIEAIETQGVMRGIVLASWRILRCNPFCKGGFDPVPPAGRWRPEAGAGPTASEDHTDVDSTAPTGEDPRP